MLRNIELIIQKYIIKGKIFWLNLYIRFLLYSIPNDYYIDKINTKNVIGCNGVEYLFEIGCSI